MIIEAVNSQKRISILQVDGERLRLLLLISMHMLLVIAFLEKVNYGGRLFQNSRRLTFPCHPEAVNRRISSF
jgi:hypothetical protein